MSEEQLIKEIQSDPHRFEELYNLHFDAIFNYCYRRTSDFDASKDLASETFLKAYVNIGRFRWRGIPVLSWLYRIATNEINLFYRSRKYKPALLNNTYGEHSIYPDLEHLAEEKESAQVELEKHEQFVRIQKTLKTLPIKYQEVISLKYFEQLKIKEICLILNKKEGTVKSLLSRGISQLKKRI